MGLPPPLVIGSEQSLSTEELEAGPAGSSPDRLLQRAEGNNEATMVLPPLLAITPGQSVSTEELEAGTESFSPDRLLQRPKEGNTAGMLRSPLPAAIAPEQPLSAELVGGNEGSFPDRLSQQLKYQPGKTSMSPPPPSLPPPLRRIARNCCSSDLKEKQRARQECRGCLGSALQSVCCLLAASMAILVVYWSLFPLCTTCDDEVLGTTSPSSPTEIAAMASDSTGGSVRPFSTLRINQLQVIRYRLHQKACGALCF